MDEGDFVLKKNLSGPPALLGQAEKEVVVVIVKADSSHTSAGFIAVCAGLEDSSCCRYCNCVSTRFPWTRLFNSSEESKTRPLGLHIFKKNPTWEQVCAPLLTSRLKWCCADKWSNTAHPMLPSESSNEKPLPSYVQLTHWKWPSH